MTEMIRSMSELKQILQNRASQALKMTRDEMFKVFQKHINEYYSENVLRSGTSSQPLIYDMTYKLLNSLIKTEVVQSGNDISCKVEIDPDYLNYTYKKGASGYEVATYANTKTHGGTMTGNIEIWNDALEELGHKDGIMKIMRNNLKKCGVPIIN